jgi:hypothetical protein
MTIRDSEPQRIAVDASETTEFRNYACPRDGCPQNYSPGQGYFTIEKNDDHWHVTGSSSLRISRSPIQVICGDKAKNLMFIEAFDARANVKHYRCPQRSCRQTMKIPADGPPAYWLGEGFFKSA